MLGSTADIEVTFLYVCHHPEYADEVWERVQEADIILCELLGPEENRAYLTSVFNDLSRLSKEEVEEAADVQEIKEACKQSELFTLRLLVNTIGTGKEIGFIDISWEDPRYAEVERAGALYNQIKAFVAKGNLKEACALYPAYNKQSSKADGIREELVVDQLRERLRDIEGRKKVVVIEGTAHTRTYDLLEREGLPLRLKYSFFPEPYVFTLEVQLEQRRRLSPEGEVSAEELLRAFVETWIIMPGVEENWPTAQLYEQGVFATRLAERLSIEEMNELLNRFSREQKKIAADTGRVSAPLVKELAERYGVTIETEAGRGLGAD